MWLMDREFSFGRQGLGNEGFWEDGYRRIGWPVEDGLGELSDSRDNSANLLVFCMNSLGHGIYSTIHYFYCCPSTFTFCLCSHLLRLNSPLQNPWVKCQQSSLLGMKDWEPNAGLGKANPSRD